MSSRVSKPHDHSSVFGAGQGQGVGTDMEWSASELDLLQAARGDQVPEHLQSRMRQVVEQHLGHAPVPGVDAAAVPSLRRAGLFGAKLALWGTLAVIVLGSVAYLAKRSQSSGASGDGAQALQLTAAQPSTSLVAELASSARQPAEASPARAEPSDGALLSREVALQEHEYAPGPRLSHDAAPSAVVRAMGSLQARDSTRTDVGRGSGLSRDRPVEGVVSGSGSQLSAAQGAQAQSQTRSGASPGPGSKETQAQPQALSASAASLPAAEPDVRGSRSGEQETGRSAPPTDQLRVEAELLDAARRALGQGALPRAAQLLDRYAAQFAHGVLHPEGDVLRIELEMRNGESAVARTEASRFLAEYPNHPLRERVRALAASR